MRFDSTQYFPCWLHAMTGRWESLPKMMEGRVGAAVLAGAKGLYVCAGNRLSSYLSSAELFDPGASQWTPLPQMRRACSDPGAVIAAGSLFVIGGEDGAGALREVQRLDLARPSAWERCPHLSTARIGPAVNIGLDGIYVFGGLSEDGLQSSAEQLSRGQWVALPGLPSGPRAGAVAISVVCSSSDAAQAPRPRRAPKRKTRGRVRRP